MTSLISRQRAAAASHAEVAEVASAMLTRGHAIDAVVAGVFAAAAAQPSVLLGPVQLLVGGAGAGLRAFDGRARQPGIGLPRPRGFRDDDVVAPAARVAAPALPSTLATVLALGGGGSLSRALGPAIDIAKAHSPARVQTLKLIARRGALALTDPQIAEELIAACGRVAGGLLSVEDLEAVRPEVFDCAMRADGRHQIATAPWVGDDAAGDGSSVEVVAAADGYGQVAIACYEARAEGVPVDALGLVAPFLATPVRRGHTRVRPGETRASVAPIALRATDGFVDVALGAARALDASKQLADAMHALSGALTLAEVIAARQTGGRVVGIMRSRDAAHAVSGREGA